jgi:hypothetical protein
MFWGGCNLASLIDRRGAKNIRSVGFNSTLLTTCMATPRRCLHTFNFKYCFVVVFGVLVVAARIQGALASVGPPSSSSILVFMHALTLLLLHLCLLHIFWALAQLCIFFFFPFFCCVVRSACSLMFVMKFFSH